MNHPDKLSIEETSDMNEAADIICSLRYDKLQELTKALSVQLAADALVDRECGRTKLAEYLSSASYNFHELSKVFNLIWKICKPHME